MLRVAQHTVETSGLIVKTLGLKISITSKAMQLSTHLRMCSEIPMSISAPFQGKYLINFGLRKSPQCSTVPVPLIYALNGNFSAFH